MTRKEKKQRADNKRKEILVKIANISSSVVDKGGTGEDAIKAAARWCVQKIKEHPQEKSMYEDAAREYANLLKSACAEAPES